MDMVRNGAMAAGILMCLGFIGAQFMGGDGDDRAEIDAAERDATVERIQPVAVVNVTGEAAETAVTEATETPATSENATAETPAAPAETAAETPAAPVETPAEPAATGEPVAAAPPAINGEALYKQVCFACHDSGAAAAPIVGKTDAWAPRIATGQEALVLNAINGKGAMPPKGGATHLSDEQITAVVVYMIQRSQ